MGYDLDFPDPIGISSAMRIEPVDHRYLTYTQKAIRGDYKVDDAFFRVGLFGMGKSDIWRQYSDSHGKLSDRLQEDIPKLNEREGDGQQ